MAKLRFGRKGRVYYHTSSFSSSGLIEVTRTKDIEFTDEAEDMTGTARDLEYNIHEQGGKEAALTFTLIAEATDQTSLTALRSAYDSQTDLYIMVLKDVKANASGVDKKFVGRVMQWNEKLPESGVTTVDVVIKPTDPDNPPADATTPPA